jgi:hypothetical protein
MSTFAAIIAALTGLCTLTGFIIRAAKTLRTHFTREVLAALDALRRTVDENERDRLRHILFHYGNTARRGGEISSEEYRYLQMCYEKYTGLGGNGIACDEMALVSRHYNACAERRETHEAGTLAQ